MANYISKGRAGEYLALFDITVNGYNCFTVTEGLTFDLGMTHLGELYRIQVKSANTKKNDRSYCFQIGRNQREYLGNNKIKPVYKEYNITDFEILALSVVPKRKVLYLPFHEVYGKKYLNFTGKESYPIDKCLQSVIDAEEK